MSLHILILNDDSLTQASDHRTEKGKLTENTQCKWIHQNWAMS